MSKEVRITVEKLLSKMNDLVAKHVPTEVIAIDRADYNYLVDLVLHGRMRTASIHSGVVEVSAYQVSNLIEQAQLRVSKRVRDDLIK